MSTARSLLKRDLRDLFRGWLSSHAQGTLASLGRLFRTPVATSMTVAVIAIALALPAGLHVLIRNVEGMAAGWDGNASLTLFLKATANDQQAGKLATELKRWPDVGGVRVITHEVAMRPFTAFFTHGEAMAYPIHLPDDFELDEAQNARRLINKLAFCNLRTANFACPKLF